MKIEDTVLVCISQHPLSDPFLPLAYRRWSTSWALSDSQKITTAEVAPSLLAVIFTAWAAGVLSRE